MWATGILAIAAMLSSSIVDVRSAAECPSSGEVLERLAPLLPQPTEGLVPPDRADSAADVARIDVVSTSADGATALRLQLQRADGHVIGERTVEVGGSCAEMADAIAVIIAAWETEPAADHAPATASPSPLPTPVPGLPAALALPAAPPAAPPPARRLALAIAAGGGVATVGGLAATAMGDLVAGRPGSHWQVRLVGIRESGRRSALGVGSVAWQHTTFAAAAVLQAMHPVWALSLDAGPSVGWAALADSGFSVNRLRNTFELGGVIGLRGGRRLGRFVLWADARVMTWTAGQQARAPGLAATTDLPPLDATLSLGVSAAILE